MTNEQIRNILSALHEALDETVPKRHYDAAWDALKGCRNVIENLVLSLEAHNHKRDVAVTEEARIYLNILSENLGDLGRYGFIDIKGYNPADLLKYTKQQMRRSRKKHHD